jgi:hypothetical protein
MFSKLKSFYKSDMFLWIWIPFWVCWMFYFFIYPEFPAAWNKPGFSLKIAGMHFFVSCFIFGIGRMIPNAKGAISLAFLVLCFAAFYFSVFLIRVFIWTKI